MTAERATAPALRRTTGRAASRAFPADGPGEIVCVIRVADHAGPPPPRPPSSREIARRKAKAEEAAWVAEAARKLAAQVQRGFRPPPGKAFGVDVGALVLIGPVGWIGTTERMARTLAPLAVGGRHPVAVLMAAGAWRDEQALREALAGIGGKLAAIGLRLDHRKGGIRMAKSRQSA